jgi:hypothetical protein
LPVELVADSGDNFRMNFKAIFGVILIAFGLYLIFGNTADPDWARQLGPYGMKSMKFCVDYFPYTAVASIVVGLAMLLTIKSYD